MTYFAEWLIIISAVIIALTVGYLLNHYALRRHRAAVSVEPVTVRRR